jgi:hypothetical protein
MKVYAKLVCRLESEDELTSYLIKLFAANGQHFDFLINLKLHEKEQTGVR